MHLTLQALAVLGGVALIVFGAETFAENLSQASARLGVTTFALAVLLAGAEPEELATTVTASLRHSPAIAYGDVIGANIAMCTVALGLAAAMTTVPVGRSARLYGLLGLPLGGIAAAMSWRGQVAAPCHGAATWPAGKVLGETAELEEARHLDDQAGQPRRLGREMALVLLGVAATVGGAVLLVDGVRGITHVETTQTRLGLILVGFATAFELVVLAWSAARRGITEAVVAGVIGSFAYNVTMSLGAGALARPLHIRDAAQLHGPWLAMVASLAVVLGIATPGGRLSRQAGWLLLGSYPLIALLVLA